MNTEERQDPFDDSMTLSERGVGFLQETAKWARFISIVGFIFIGLMLIASIAMFTFMGSFASAEIPGMSPYGSPFGPMGGTFFGIVYVISVLIAIFPLLYLYRFGSNTLKAIKNEDEMLVETGLENLKSHYKFYGIIMIVILGIYALFFLIGIIGTIAAAF